MVVVAQQLRKVLVQGATQRHVHYLEAPADTQQRQITPEGGPTKCQLPGITFVTGGIRFWMGGRPVATWVEVSAPCDNQTVQVRQQTLWSVQ
jgi:hypothetical protein